MQAANNLLFRCHDASCQGLEKPQGHQQQPPQCAERMAPTRPATLLKRRSGPRCHLRSPPAGSCCTGHVTNNGRLGERRDGARGGGGGCKVIASGNVRKHFSQPLSQHILRAQRARRREDSAQLPEGVLYSPKATEKREREKERERERERERKREREGGREKDRRR